MLTTKWKRKNWCDVYSLSEWKAYDRQLKYNYWDFSRSFVSCKFLKFLCTVYIADGITFIKLHNFYWAQLRARNIKTLSKSQISSSSFACSSCCFFGRKSYEKSFEMFKSQRIFPFLVFMKISWRKFKIWDQRKMRFFVITNFHDQINQKLKGVRPCRWVRNRFWISALNEQIFDNSNRFSKEKLRLKTIEYELSNKITFVLAPGEWRQMCQPTWVHSKVVAVKASTVGSQFHYVKSLSIMQMAFEKTLNIQINMTWISFCDHKRCDDDCVWIYQQSENQINICDKVRWQRRKMNRLNIVDLPLHIQENVS